MIVVMTVNNKFTSEADVTLQSMFMEFEGESQEFRMVN